MRKEERLIVEQRVLEVMKDYPTTLDSISLSLPEIPFVDKFQAILYLMKSGDCCYHKVRGMSAYRRTQQGFNRRWAYYD